MKLVKKVGIAALTLLASSAAFATDGAIDTSAVVALIDSMVTVVGVLGGAFLIFTVTKKAWGKLGG